MAKMCFLVIVFILVQQVFANICENDGQISSCDECIRCGGSWCSQKADKHCDFYITDVFCDGNPEELTRIDPITIEGIGLRPSYSERTLFVGTPDSLPFVFYSPVKSKVSTEILNTTQSLKNIDVIPEEAVSDHTKNNRWSLNIVTTVHEDFCTSVGTTREFIYVKIKVDNTTQEAVIKYHVPCACECSKKVERKSARCNGNGDLSCGVCSCYPGWSGEDCKISECGTKRGDVQCNNPLKNDKECSGNGYCGPCETCICYADKEGSQYFDPENYCSDICMDTSGCGQCLTNGTIGECADTSGSESECVHPMTVEPFNETIAADRKIWARCNNTFTVERNYECYVEYVAMKTENSRIHVMVVKSCNDHSKEAIGGAIATRVPIILGILGIIAVVAAVGGIMLWKHLNAAPPMPFSSPDYQNIDAEDCVGENPLYKSPTTTFTNPQFGKC